MTSVETFARICRLLDDQRSEYHVLNHGPCRTSAESAVARAQAGFPEAIGAKALLLKLERSRGPVDASVTSYNKIEFDVFVLPGPAKIASQSIKNLLDVRKFRFATRDEMFDRCSVVPGCMPPFARNVFPQLNSLFVDESLASYEWLGFNAASLERSIVVRSKDYFRAAAPVKILNFAVI